MSSQYPHEKPVGLEVIPEFIPAELKILPRWTGWRYTNKDGKWTKLPLQAKNPSMPASSTDPKTWADFDTTFDAYKAGHFDGIMFALSSDDPYTVVDMDGCAIDEDLNQSANDALRRLNTYSELSPSGTGVHIWCRAEKPGEKSGAKSIGYEFYASKRFMTVTGASLVDCPETIENRQDELNALYAEVFPAPAIQEPTTSSNGAMPSLSDDEVIAKARSAKNGDKFSRLWTGDTSHYDNDDSRADAALAGTLAFWTNDDSQVERLMRRSGLNREKFDRPDYLERTIGAARRGQTESYSQSGPTLMLRPFVFERRPWPQLHPDALYGLAGDVVRAIDPHTEADQVATLATFLGMYGSAAGRTAHVWIGEDRHGMNENFALVGETSNGRKGSSMSGVLRIMAGANEDWYKSRRVSGLASGEGFIWQIRDAIYKLNKKGENELVDEGVKDKRLFVLEEELSKVLNQTERKDNTLSGYIRVAWDSRDKIQKLTISNPCEASNPHVSILGHITETELRRKLNETEIANGFANRFLWLCVRRSKAIPEPTRMSADVVRELSDRVRRSLDHARRTTDFAFSDSARTLWVSVYGPLTDGHKGLYGALTARGAAHVRRLSLMYAALDLSSSVDACHLRAALALWKYADDSAQFLFGDTTGNSIADRILEELRSGQEMTATNVRDLFSRNQSGRTDAALRELIDAGLIGQRKSTEGNGRPATVFYAIASYDRNDRNDKSPLIELGHVSAGYDKNDQNDKSQQVAAGQTCAESGCNEPVAPGNSYYCSDHDPRRREVA